METIENTTNLRDVTSGYARVANETGHTIGRVSRERSGSTRTGTMWVAETAGRRALGTAYTRDAAVALVVAAHEARR